MAIQIPIEAIDNASAPISKIKGELTGLTQAQNTGTAANTKAAFSWTELNSAVAIGRQVFDAAGKVIGATAGITLEYANQVRDLKAISGESTENTSRFIQVLDDYEISADDAMIATKALTKQGLAPNLETLASLSEQYLAINDVEKANEFILKNLGKAGLQWVNVLKQGPEALRAQGAAVNANLILDAKAAKEAETYRLALDNSQDAVRGLQIALGKELIPVMTDVITEVTDFTEGVSENWEAIKKWGNILSWVVAPQMKLGALLGDGVRDFNANTEAVSTFQRALNALGEEAEQVTLPVFDKMNVILADHGVFTEADAEAVKAATSANEGYLSSIGGLTNTLEGERKKTVDLIASHNDLIAKKAELIAQGYGPESDAIQEIDAKLAENSAAQAQNAIDVDKASKARILSMLQEQLSAGGLNQAETDYLLDLGVKWGVYSQSAVDEAKKAEAEAAILADAFNNLPENRTMTITTIHQSYEYGSAGYEHVAHPGRAGGGQVVAGQPYWVGERGPEKFVPAQSGSIIANGQSGGTAGMAAMLAGSMPSAKDIGRETALAIMRMGLGVSAR